MADIAVKRSVESSKIGHGGKNFHYGKIVSPDTLYTQLLALKSKQDVRVLGDGLTQDEFNTHFNQLVDKIKANPWMNGCINEVNWEEYKITFNNGVEIAYS